MWHHLFLSHKQVQGVFGDEPPSIERVWGCELLFKSLANMHFSAYVECPVDRFPKAWRTKGFDAMQFRFTVVLHEAPKFTGIPASPTYTSIQFEANCFCIEALDQSWSVKGQALLETVYAEPFKDPGPGHDHDWFRVSYR
jgi:hypothetical protein